MVSRTTRILFAAALLAAGVYFAVVRPHDRASDNAESSGDRLASFDIADIDSIAIEHHVIMANATRFSESPLMFVKTDSLWRMTLPVQDSAEPGAIGTLLDALRTSDINRNLGQVEDLKQYGLDPPDAYVTLVAAHRRVLHVEIGKNTVDGAWCYARNEAGEVLLIPTDVRRSAMLPVDAYRNHRVLDFKVADVTAYAIKNARSTMTWERRGTGWYALSGRDSVMGDSIAVTSPLHRLRGLRVSMFHQDFDAIALPADSVYTMTLFMGPKNRTELTFEHYPSAWIAWNHGAAGGPRIMTVDDDISDLFAHTVNTLRERRLLQFDPAVTHRINYAAPTATGELVRSGGHWAFPNPMMGRVNPDYAADFVRALRGLKWSEPGDEAARTTGRVSYRIEIMGEGDRIIDQLTAGPYDASTSWVTSRSSHGTWLVENARLDEISQRFARLKQR